MKSTILACCMLLIVACAPPSQTGSLDILFCQRTDCEEAFADLVDDQSFCAFYDLESPVLEGRLDPDRTLVFDENHEGFGIPIGSRALMHNKFCLTDGHVITGSLNPTANGFRRNDNHLVIIEGPLVTENYRAEYRELKEGRERRTPHTRFSHNGFLIENYFCPEDDCEHHVLATLDDADVSITFMTFSFTSDAIGDLLVEKHRRGIDVHGIMERRQSSRWSEYEKLRRAGINVSWDANPGMMHHKVFVVDAGRPDAAVITGSYNPTKSGTTRNDENILILHDKGVAQLFREEYRRVASFLSAS